MKKIICLLLFLGVANYMYSQLQQGNVLLGLGGRYYQSKGTLANYNTQTVVPTSVSNRNAEAQLRIGYFVTDRVVVGASAGYVNNWQSYQISSQLPGSSFRQDQELSTFLYGVFGRCYKMFGERVGVFAQLRINYLFGDNSNAASGSGNNNPSSLTKTVNGLDAALTPGVVFFINKYIGLEATIGNLGFMRFTETDRTGGRNTVNTTNSWDTNFGLGSAMIGVNFYFGVDKTSNQ